MSAKGQPPKHMEWVKETIFKETQRRQKIILIVSPSEI